MTSDPGHPLPVSVTIEFLYPTGFVSLADAAKWLGVSPEAVRKAIRSGRLPAQRERSSGKQGWRYVIRTTDLNLWKRRVRRDSAR